MKAVIHFLAGFAFSVTAVYAQDSLPVDIQKIIDDVGGAADGSPLPERLYENLLLIYNEPYDLNKVTEEELRLLYFLTDQQIHDFINYRAQQKTLLSVYELQVITSMDDETLTKLRNFVTVNELTASVDRSLIDRVLTNKQNYTLFRYDRIIEEKTGYGKSVPDEKRFKGSPDRLLVRYRNSRPGDFSIGFALEKDAGERLSWNTSLTGFDFCSFHLQVLNKKRVRNLLIGDFQVQAGQGLVLGGLFGLGKGGETVTSIRKANLGGMPYTSTTENMNLRGALVTISLSKNLLFTTYGSIAKRDAALTADSVEGPRASGLPSSGLHRSESELRTRKALTELNTAAMLEYRVRAINAGIIVNHVEFGKPIAPEPSRYNQFHFRDIRNTNGSVYFEYTINNINFFSEWAQTLGKGKAWVSGLLVNITPSLDLSLLYRNYDRDFHTFYANGFGESSSVQNETGLYWGWKYKWNKRYSLAGYMDLFRFPWIRYRVYSPSTGYEWLARLNLQPAKHISAYIQIREESKGRNVSNPGFVSYPVARGVRRNYLGQVTLEADEHVTLRTRVQFSTFDFNDSFTSGMVMAQDFRLNVGRFTLTGRYALFDTDNYDNRQFTYENDVYLSFSMPAYDGQGVRKYLMMEYKCNRHLSFWFRVAHTRYVDRDRIGSGYDTILGNTRNDIKFQLRLKL